MPGAGVNTNIETEFAKALAKAGLGSQKIPADRNLHRFPVPSDRPGQRTGWAILFANHGVAGDWRTGNRVVWRPEGSPLSKVERRHIAQALRQRRIERAEAARKAAAKAKALFDRMPAVDPKHPYLAKKQISAGPCRQIGNSLIVPVMTASGEITSLQFIGPDGSKRFLAGGSIKGGQCMLGDASGADPIVVCEGFATGASIREATGWPVVVAFNTANLQPVAETLRKKHPHRQIIVAADNDDTTEGNPGLTKGKKVAQGVAGRLVFPPAGGDFNDMQVKSGLEAVAEIFTTDKLAASAKEIIESPNVLDRFSADWRNLVAGEERNAKILFLVATSRLFSKTMHTAIKGPSSGGKSEIRTRVLQFFPPEAVISFTTLSEKALLYIKDDFSHRILSMGEAAGADEQKLQDYLLR
jgi:putative DNA primase/helicase